MNVLDMLQNRYPGMFGGGTAAAPTGSTLVSGTVGGGGAPGGGGGGTYSPAPTRGQGAFGLVPGQVNVPQDIQDNITYDAKGILRPDVAAKLQNEAAAKGVASGMPGSGMQWNSYLHDYLGASDVARQRAYNNFLGLVPLAEQNAVNAASPDPQQRGELEWSHAKEMFDRYLSQLGWGGRGGGGGGFRGPAGGTTDVSSPAGGTRDSGGAAPLPTSRYPSNAYPPDSSKPWDWGAPGGTWYDASNDTYNAPGSMGQSNQLSQNDIDRLIENYMNEGDAWQ